MFRIGFLCSFLPALSRTVVLLPKYVEGDFLEDSLQAGPDSPYFGLHVSGSTASPSRSSDFACIAAAVEKVIFAWYVGNTQWAGEDEYDVPLGNSLQMQYSRFSVKTANPGQAVSCRIVLRDATIKLSSDIATGTFPLHMTYDDDCGWKSRRCVGYSVFCDWWSSLGPKCTCERDTYYNVEVQMCVEKKRGGEACLFERQCPIGTQWCNGNRCTCRNDFTLVGSSCMLNSTLRSLCDESRLCPSGSECIDSACQCSEEYYEWGDSCVKRVLSVQQSKTAAMVLLTVSSVIFTMTMAALGVYFYKNSYRPSTLHERSGSSWDFLTGSSASRKSTF